MFSYLTLTPGGNVSRTGARQKIARTPALTRRSAQVCAASGGTVSAVNVKEGASV